MNLLSWLNPGRWLLVLAAISALVLGYGAWAKHQQNIGYSRAQAEYATAALKSEQAALAKEQTLQSKLKKAQDDAKLRETKLAADAGRARAAADGLRHDLAATRAKLSQASRASIAEYAATSTELLDQCGAAYTDMAGKASGHASDALMLLDGWPK